LAYGKTREDAIAKVEALALRVIADRIDHGETIPELDELFAVPA
jgi:predicted RNase H-like HicB family nuclease